MAALALLRLQDTHEHPLHLLVEELFSRIITKKRIEFLFPAQPAGTATTATRRGAADNAARASTGLIQQPSLCEGFTLTYSLYQNSKVLYAPNSESPKPASKRRGTTSTASRMALLSDGEFRVFFYIVFLVVVAARAPQDPSPDPVQPTHTGAGITGEEGGTPLAPSLAASAAPAHLPFPPPQLARPHTVRATSDASMADSVRLAPEPAQQTFHRGALRVVLDEPAAHMDPHLAYRCWNLLENDDAFKHSVVFIIITHRIVRCLCVSEDTVCVAHVQRNLLRMHCTALPNRITVGIATAF